MLFCHHLSEIVQCVSGASRHICSILSERGAGGRQAAGRREIPGGGALLLAINGDGCDANGVWARSQSFFFRVVEHVEV
jgi:hypothetical protein